MLQTILFTMDEDTLEAVSLHDLAFRADFMLDEDDLMGEDRPKTADQEGQVMSSPIGTFHAQVVGLVMCSFISDSQTSVQM